MFQMENMMMMMKIAVLCVIILAMPDIVTGYPSGAPSGACESMTPNHGAPASVPPVPYTLTVSSTTYNCGDVITVTLANATSGDTFKGFLCQARPDVNRSSTVGKLAASGALAATTNCGDGAITHSESSDKISAVFTWTASGDNPTVNIVCTVVKAKTTFWVKGVRQPITFSGTTGTCSKAMGSRGSGFLVLVLSILVALQWKLTVA
ncbi:putative defense protein 3 [Mya arenaria]|uniref:putative defense protein 3 n=1 Tax=Mya arenaria TaxID=6604 RepID=UPI0022E44677|nr:putative defense protein 3 [Mya arenaria]